MNLVYAKSQFSSTTEHGQIVRVQPNEAWDANDPFVKAHKDMFSKTPIKARTVSGWVETATAEPGEKRKSGR